MMTDDTAASSEGTVRDRQLQLAIEHITVSTQAWISAKGQEKAYVPAAAEVVNVFDTTNDPGDQVPADLRECILHARRVGYSTVTFNTSGTSEPELPRYD